MHIAILWIVLVVLSCVLFYFVLGPAWVHGKIDSALRDAGVKDVEFQVVSVSTNGIELSGFSIGKTQPFQIGRISAAYDLASVRRGEVGAINVDGASLEIRVDDAGVNLGPLASLGGPDGGSADAKPISLPFQKLELQRSALLLDWHGVRVQIPIEGTVTNLSANQIGIDATIRVADFPVRARGTLTQPAGKGGAWGVDLAVEPMKWQGGGTSVEMNGVKITGSFGGEKGTDLHVELLGASASSDGRRFSDITAKLHIRSGADESAKGEFHVGTVAVGERTFPSIAGTVRVAGGRAEVGAEWSLIKAAPIVLNAWFDSAVTSGVTAKIAPFDLGAAKELAELVPALASLDLGGTVAIDARVDAASGQFVPSVTVHATEVRVADKESGAGVSGINGDFTFNPFSPMAAVMSRRIELPRVATGGGAGLGDVALRLDSASESRVDVGGLSIGKDGRVRIDSLGLSFVDVAGKKSLGDIQIDGATIDLRMRNGSLDLGPLASVQGGGKATAGPPMSALPFASFKVRRSAVILDWEGVRIHLPVECTIANSESGKVAVDATATLLDRPVRVHGTLTMPTRDVEKRWGVDLAVEIPEWNSGGVRVSIKSVKITGHLEQLSDGGLSAALELAITGGVVSSEAQALSDFSLTLPIVVGGPAKAGIFRVGEVTAGKRKFPAVEGTLKIADGRAEFTADWPLLKKLPISAQGWIDSGLRAEVNAKILPFTLSEVKELSELVPALAGLDMDGTISADAVMKLVAGKFTQRVTLHTKDARFADKDAGLTIEGITGDLAFTRFSPLGTRGGQKFTIAKMTLGDLTLTDGELGFQLERPDSVLIEKTLWHMDGGGIVRFYGARIEPAKPIAAEVFFENIEVARFVSLLLNPMGAGDKVSAEGKMYGRVPFVLSPNDEKKTLGLGRGFLYANPGPGLLRLKDKQIVASLLEGMALDAMVGEVRARLEEALGNFEFSELSFEVIPDGGQVRGVLFTKGKNRNPDRPVNFQGLTANFNDLENALNDAIFGGKQTGKGFDRFKDWLKKTQ